MKHLLILILLCGICPIGQNKVIRITDGDTIKVDGYDKPIRILGIDTPETRRGKRLRRQAKRMGITEDEALKLGLYAKAKARKILLNKCITLELGRVGKGRFGRPLRYVRVDELDYSAFMLKEGLAMSYCGDKKDERYEYYNNLGNYSLSTSNQLTIAQGKCKVCVLLFRKSKVVCLDGLKKIRGICLTKFLTQTVFFHFGKISRAAGGGLC